MLHNSFLILKKDELDVISCHSDSIFCAIFHKESIYVKTKRLINGLFKVPKGSIGEQAGLRKT